MLSKQKKTTHILVIRLSAMGDVAMTSIVLRALIDQNPNVKITLLSKAFLKPIFEELPNVHFYTADTTSKHKGFLGIYKLYKELKKLKIDAIADLHNVLRSKVLKLFFSDTKKATLNKGRKEKKALTRAKNKIFTSLKITHERYADVFRALGFNVDLSKVKFPKPKKLTQNLTAIIGNKNEQTKLLGIAPFAQYKTKTYPLALMKNVIAELSKQKRIKILMFGGGKEQIAVLSALENNYKNVVCVAGKTKIKEELQLISNLDCMVSMDSGNAHFASIYNVPTITIWGNTHPYAGFYPFGQPLENAILPDIKKFPKLPTSVYGNKIVEGYENVMETIKPEEVVRKILEILGKN
ncbi:MAG: glycosyltransferase family 9 protein [Polaribacter sp.]